ncbi:MAG: hypothetical protein KatS3mg057_1598 [Herpetosiphonaceae bacterium]|nr:MAG: hypothetical protein KatS3mg057_1598 [Herpetosiphonaceae bacterium]
MDEWNPQANRPPPAYGGLLIDRLIAFGRLLRDLGLPIGPDQTLDVMRALRHISIDRREDFKLACRTVYVRRREDLPIFEQAWDYFWAAGWHGGDQRALLPHRVRTLKLPARLRRPPPTDADRQMPEQERKDQRVEIRLSYSSQEVLRSKDFAECTADELAAVQRLIADMRYVIQPRRTRRHAPQPHGRKIDIRRALRRSLRTGGEVVSLPTLDRKQRQRPLVILCDISGSMERYSRVLLYFAYAVAASVEHVEVFVFGTRLTRITRLLRQRDIDEALSSIGRTVQDWTGGTRIGDAVKTFNFRWGRRVLGRGAVVLLISDGWDRGDPELLAHEMARLQRNSFRLIWLNPLLGSPDYQPLTRGIQAALPYVDDFLPVHNLHSLEQLGKALSAIGDRRPERRQHSGHSMSV